MTTTTNVPRINNLHPLEYAQQWGAPGNNHRFYNCASFGGSVYPNPEWTTTDWRCFLVDILRQRSDVQRNIFSGAPLYSAEDIIDLWHLAEYVRTLIGDQS